MRRSLLWVTVVGCAQGAPSSSGSQADVGPPGTEPGRGDAADQNVLEILPEDLIDDLDDGDGALPERAGRVGFWYTYNDGSAGGTQNPAPEEDFLPTAPGRGGSGFAARLSGRAFTVWGAGMAFDLNNPGDAADGGAMTKGVYDASGFTGIAFWSTSTTGFRVSVPVRGVVETSYGGDCVPGATEAEECGDAHGMNLGTTGSWQQHVIPFADLTQAGWGRAVAWDPRSLVGVEFQVAAGLEFAFAIDEIGFYR